MNLYEEIEKIKASGYSEQNAQSKLGQEGGGLRNALA